MCDCTWKSNYIFIDHTQLYGLKHGASMCIQLPLLIQLLRLLASYTAIKLIIQLHYSYIAT